MERSDGQAMEERLAALGERIQTLKGRLVTVGGEIRAELARRLEAVDVEQGKQLQRLRRRKDRGPEPWGTHEDQAGEIRKGLEKSLQDLASRLKK